VALRQIWIFIPASVGQVFCGSSLPVKHRKIDVVIFRENTEDVYIGIEWKSGTPEAKSCWNS